MIKLLVFKKKNYIIMEVTILCHFKSWEYCFQLNEGIRCLSPDSLAIYSMERNHLCQ